MRRFADLYAQLDSTTRTTRKQSALEAYFQSAPRADSAWALRVLTGRPVRRAITSPELRDLVATRAELPPWMVEACRVAVGDQGETLALLLPPPLNPRDIPLHEVIELGLLPMRRMSPAQRAVAMGRLYDELDSSCHLALHKLLSGTFRVGVSTSLVTKALSAVAGVSPDEMALRLIGQAEPDAAAMALLLAPAERDEAERSGSPSPRAPRLLRPFPFFLAHSHVGSPESLGPCADWQVEWKWDGIRSQLVVRGRQAALWSRGEELISGAFPEILAAAEALPDGTVLDGELLAWPDQPQGAGPLPFAVLQRRLNVKRREHRLFEDNPVRFLAYDLLEHEGVDLRASPLRQRRAHLEALMDRHPLRLLTLSPLLQSASWRALELARSQSRERGVEGLMLKHRDSCYGVGRTMVAHDDGPARVGWWKWKVDPFTVDAVLVAAQPGHGKRAGLLTDYTFAVWKDTGRAPADLVTVAKAYSGLTDAEILTLDKWCRRHTTGEFGPVRSVQPLLVFELAFDGVATSPRHKAGLALRFPRVARQRTDKTATEADNIAALSALVHGATEGAP